MRSGGMHGPSNFGVDPMLAGRNSKFLSYLGWLECAHSTLPVNTGTNAPLFPCLLPYPEAIGDRVTIEDEYPTALWAKRFVNVFCAWSNYVVLGCPDCMGNTYEPQVTYRASESVRGFADKLLGEVAEFGSNALIEDALNCSGGRLAVEEIFEQVASATGSYTDWKDSCNLGGALPVVPERVAMPEAAGSVDPLNFLEPDRRMVVADLEQLRKPEHLWDNVPVACHRVSADDEARLVEKLVAHGMVRLMPESELPRDSQGCLLCGGFFAVPKNEVEDRLIFDRRPENATMNRITWAKLPAGACLTRMLLKPHEYIRGSGDDLRNFYYTLKLPDNWVRFNSVGRRVDASVVQRCGGDASVPHRMCMRVLGMGDTNACDIAQATHESILRAAGLLTPDSQLIYGEPAPSGDLWDGVYLDDLLVVSKCMSESPIDPHFFVPPPAAGDDADMVRMRSAEEAYFEAGLLRAEHKAFRGQTDFKAWGAEVRGVRGTVGAPLDFCRQTWKLLQRVVRFGYCTKKILQKLLGYCCFIFQFRRELYALQHHIYKYVDKMPKKGWRRLPVFICDELRSLAFHIPFAKWDMRKQLSSSLLATDATPTSAGAARADVTEELSRELWQQSEVRGSAVRLDSQVIDDLLDWDTPREPSLLASVLGLSLLWRATSSYNFRQTSHINLQEARALKNEIVKQSSDPGQTGRIQMCLNDSRVVCGAVAKGRSSSFKLNGILRSMLPFLVLGNLSLAMIWVETHSNPADHPSRFVPIPAPSLSPKWLKRFSSRAVGVGWEIFAGTARLTRAHEQLGVSMLAAVEILLGSDALSSTIDDDLRRGLADWIWLAPPCGTFSPLRNLDIGGPLRPKGNPQGDESIEEIYWGNLLWRRAIFLANLCVSLGIYFFLEHPLNSKAWQLPETQALLNRCGVYSVAVDWCMYDDPEREGPPNKKATRIIGTGPWLRDVISKCDGSHVHASRQAC